MTLRGIAKSIVYESGALDLYHRARNGEHLTVLMFHRILRRGDSERFGADPVYAITPELLAEILSFFAQNYEIVDMQDVLASLARKQRLPRRSVLITFDDGWRDNLECGLPVLRGIPWALFVASDAIAGQDYWWQEVLLWGLRTKRVSWAEIRSRCARLGASGRENCDGDLLDLLQCVGELPLEERHGILADLEGALRSEGAPRHMLTASEIEQLRQAGIALGGHGASHLPLSRLNDPAADLRRSKEWLAQAGGLPVMSCPHGRYDERTIGAARDLGYSAVFTSDPVLNACPDGWLRSNFVGRISVDAARIVGERKALAKDRLAALLYLARTN